MKYIVKDNDGNILAFADHEFHGSEPCPCDVIRYPDGGLYRVDALPTVYGNPGTSEQQIGGECPMGWVTMSGPRPSDTYGDDGTVIKTWIAKESGEWEPVSTAPSRIRTERDRRLSDCAWIVERHRDQLASGEATTLTEEQYRAWLGYRQELRDIPQQLGFPWGGPDDPDCPWPVEPLSK